MSIMLLRVELHHKMSFKSTLTTVVIVMIRRMCHDDVSLLIYSMYTGQRGDRPVGLDKVVEHLSTFTGGWLYVKLVAMVVGMYHTVS